MMFGLSAAKTVLKDSRMTVKSCFMGRIGNRMKTAECFWKSFRVILLSSFCCLLNRCDLDPASVEIDPLDAFQAGVSQQHIEMTSIRRLIPME